MRYFFDTDDGTGEVRDTDGHDLDDLEAVRKAAIDFLPDVARDELPDGNHRVFKVRVRNESGTYIFEATLTLEAGWLASAK